MSSTAQTRSRPSPVDLPLAGCTIGFVVLYLAPLLARPVLHTTGRIPTPFASTSAVQAYFTTNQTTIQASSFLMFASAVFLLLFTTVAMTRLTRVGPRALGPMLTGFSGQFAAGLLAASALAQWVLAQPPVLSQPTLTHSLDDVVYVTGGPGHVTALGLLVFGLAHTCRSRHLHPRWLWIFGYLIAAAAVLSSVSLLVTPAAVLIPLGRFTTMPWLIAMSLLIRLDTTDRNTIGVPQ
jgi:hypothetical protein